MVPVGISESALPRSSCWACTPFSGVECDLGRRGGIENQAVGCCLILRRCMVKRRPAAYSRVSDGACRHTSAMSKRREQETDEGYQLQDSRGFSYAMLLAGYVLLSTCRGVEILLPSVIHARESVCRATGLLGLFWKLKAFTQTPSNDPLATEQLRVSNVTPDWNSRCSSAAPLSWILRGREGVDCLDSPLALRGKRGAPSCPSFLR